MEAIAPTLASQSRSTMYEVCTRTQGSHSNTTPSTGNCVARPPVPSIHELDDDQSLIVLQLSELHCSLSSMDLWGVLLIHNCSRYEVLLHIPCTYLPYLLYISPPVPRADLPQIGPPRRRDALTTPGQGTSHFGFVLWRPSRTTDVHGAGIL